MAAAHCSPPSTTPTASARFSSISASPPDHQTRLQQGRRRKPDCPGDRRIAHPPYAFVAKVDGEKVISERKAVDPGDQRRVHRLWVCWPMRVEAGQKRRVEVTYEIETRDPIYVRPYSPLQPRELTYVLKTGCGWQDVIGSARIVLRCASRHRNRHWRHRSQAPVGGCTVVGGVPARQLLLDVEDGAKRNQGNTHTL